jgi:8-oxo-dGTP pyrophosphatase MutT (NUDIX family)
VSRAPLDDNWRQTLARMADSPPLRPRVPLSWQGARIGSVESDLLARLPDALQRGLVTPVRRDALGGWQVEGELTRSLHELAMLMRDAGLADVWRDEQLAVTDESGKVLGTVERAVVRPLGIATRAVHLLGYAREGRHWIQQRSFAKANDPGLLDTLVGGMVPASDSLSEALERETWEEAGLKLDQVEQLHRGGAITIRSPSHSGFGGYIVEQIDWYRCVLPDAVVPANQDGEVQEFRLMSADEVRERVLGREFTLEAALLLAQAGL